jgi:hypothetical protein
MKFSYWKYILLTSLFIGLFVFKLSSQPNLHSTETLLYSFTTQSGKTMILAKDKKDAYIVYRFGTKDKIELEVLDKTKKQFKYSFYLRGGGKANEGMDLNYVYFTNKDFKYVIFDTYSANGNVHKIGLRLINLKTNEAAVIKGIEKTKKGNLIDFRDNGLLEIGEELFEE